MRLRFFRLVELARVKILPIKDLWLFIIAVILISMTSASIGAFVIGIRPTEFFLGDTEDILVVTPPDAATPLTGSVDYSLIEDIKRLEGVKGVSAEVLGVVIAQNMDDEAIIIRGLTNDFLTISNISSDDIEGNCFLNQSNKFGAIAGIDFVNDRNKNIGDKLILVSTLTPMTLEVTIDGIINTSTPIDSEIILPLKTAQSLTGRSADKVTFIRVKVDLDEISKTELADIINSEYPVRVLVRCEDPTLDSNLPGQPVLVYSLAGEVIATQNLDEKYETTFVLPFGSYRLISIPSFTEQSPPEDVFVNGPNIPITELTVGRSNHELTVNVTFNGQPAYNAAVSVEERFNNSAIETRRTSVDGLAIFDLKEEYYIGRVKYKNFTQTFQKKLNQTWQEDVAIENSFYLIVKNASRSRGGGEYSDVINGILELRNSSTQELIIRDSSYNASVRDKKYLANSGTYIVNYTVDEITRIWDQKIPTQPPTLFVGKGELNITLYDFNDSVLRGANVSIYTNGEFSNSNITNIDGVAKFNLETGVNYTIKVEHPINNTITNDTLFFRKPTSINLSFIDQYWFEIKVFNGTEVYNETADIPNATGLSGCSILLYNPLNRSDIIHDTETLENGTKQIEIDLGRYRINATYGEFTWDDEVEVNKSLRTTMVNIPLGTVKLNISTRTSSGNPINGTLISVVNMKEGDGFFTETFTDENGTALLYVPKGAYRLEIRKLYHFLNKTLPYFEHSQAFLFESVFDLRGTLIIRVEDSVGQGISSVTIEVENNLFGNKASGITSENAEIVFPDLPWGIYEVDITVPAPDENLEFLFKIPLVEGENRTVLRLNLDPGTLFDFKIGKWRGQVNIAVIESAEYLSDFLNTTLEIIETALIALVIAIAGLSLLSVSSVISHPISSNADNLFLVKTIGGSNKQVNSIITTQMTVIGLIASIVGAMMGTLIMTIETSPFRKSYIAGIKITPETNLVVIIGIMIIAVIVIIMKTGQTLDNIQEKSEAESLVHRHLTRIKSRKAQKTKIQMIQNSWESIIKKFLVFQQTMVSSITKYPRFIGKVSELFEKIPKSMIPFLVVLGVSLLIRIPLIPNVAGADGFQAMWQAQQIILGNAELFLVHPLSILGLFSFSGYPIGTPLIIAIMLILTGGNIPLATHLFTISFCLVTSYTSTLMIKEFNDDPLDIIIGGVLYTSIPILLRFTYFSTTARTPFLALVPLVFVYLNRWRINKRVSDLVKSLITLLSLNLFHRMAVPFLLFFFVTLIFATWILLMEEISINKGIVFSDLLTWTSRRIILVIWPIIYFLGLINPLVPSNYIDPIDIGFPLEELNTIFQQILDYGLAWGIIIFFVIIRIIYTLISNAQKEVEGRLSDLFLVFLLTPFIITLNNPSYMAFVLIPIISILGVRGLSIVLQNSKLRSIFSWFLGIFLIVFWVFIYQTQRSIPLLLFIFTFFAIILFILAFIQRIFEVTRPLKALSKEQLSRISVVFFLMTILAHSFILVQVRLTPSPEIEFPLKYISEEEITIANYLKSQAPTGFFSAYRNSELELRIAAYSGWLCFESSGISLLISGAISKESVLKNSTLSNVTDWFQQYIFQFQHENPMYEKATRIWYSLLRHEIDSTVSKEIMNVTNLEYFVTYRDSDLCITSWGSGFFSLFIHSMKESSSPLLPYAESVLNTTHLSLWKIYK